MRLPCPKRFGFTLIEMLVAVTIGGVLLAGGIAAYRGTGKRIIVRQAGEKLATELRAVQKKALSGEKPSVCSEEGEDLISYQVNYKDSYSYTIQADCETETEEPIKIISLPSGVEFETINFNIQFPALGGAVSGAQTITIKHEDGNYLYGVIVAAGGVISGGFQ